MEEKDIKIDNNTIFFRTWFSKEVSTIENLPDYNLDFLTQEEFKSDGQEISTIEWQELKNRFPSFFVYNQLLGR